MTTYGQRVRQETRSRDGRYRVINKCERCRKSVGADYHSDHRCNVDGLGLVLCAGCCGITSAMSDAEFFAYRWMHRATLAGLGFDPAATTSWGGQPSG